MIKSAKKAIKGILGILGDADVSDEELHTAICGAEKLLNEAHYMSVRIRKTYAL